MSLPKSLGQIQPGHGAPTPSWTRLAGIWHLHGPGPFPLQALREISRDLGKCSDDADKYIKVFQSLIQMSELSYRDLVMLLGQTLPPSEKQT